MRLFPERKGVQYVQQAEPYYLVYSYILSARLIQQWCYGDNGQSNHNQNLNLRTVLLELSSSFLGTRVTRIFCTYVVWNGFVLGSNWVKQSTLKPTHEWHLNIYTRVEKVKQYVHSLRFRMVSCTFDNRDPRAREHVTFAHWTCDPGSSLQ